MFINSGVNNINLQLILISRRYHEFYLKYLYGFTIMSDLHRSYSTLSVENLYAHTCFLASFVFITQCRKRVCTYVFSGIIHIHPSVWKTRMYIRVFWYHSYSSLSVRNSYVQIVFGYYILFSVNIKSFFLNILFSVNINSCL